METIVQPLFNTKPPETQKHTLTTRANEGRVREAKCLNATHYVAFSCLKMQATSLSTGKHFPSLVYIPKRNLSDSMTGIQQITEVKIFKWSVAIPCYAPKQQSRREVGDEKGNR